MTQNYVVGGVNRGEAMAPMAPRHGATVRALVLKANTGAQLYIDELTTTPPLAPSSDAPEPSSSTPLSTTPDRDVSCAVCDQLTQRPRV